MAVITLGAIRQRYHLHSRCHGIITSRNLHRWNLGNGWQFLQRPVDLMVHLEGSGAQFPPPGAPSQATLRHLLCFIQTNIPPLTQPTLEHWLQKNPSVQCDTGAERVFHPYIWQIFIEHILGVRWWTGKRPCHHELSFWARGEEGDTRGRHAGERCWHHQVLHDAQGQPKSSKQL